MKEKEMTKGIESRGSKLVRTGLMLSALVCAPILGAGCGGTDGPGPLERPTVQAQNSDVDSAVQFFAAGSLVRVGPSTFASPNFAAATGKPGTPADTTLPGGTITLTAQTGAPSVGATSVPAPSLEPTVETWGSGDFAPGQNMLAGDLLLWGAAQECGVGLPGASTSGAPIPGSADNVALEVAVLHPWESPPGGGLVQFYFPPRAGCDALTLQQEALVCMAGKLKELADAVAPVTWTRPDPTITGLAAPWVFPPQTSASKYGLRDLAVYALANATLLDLWRIDYSVAGTSFESRVCVDAYAAALDSAPAGVSLTSVFGASNVRDLLPPNSIPGATPNANEMAAARLQYRTQVFRAGNRLLKSLVEDGHREHMANAFSLRARTSDPVRGPAYMWGQRDDGAVSHGTLAQAARVLMGRWEMTSGGGIPLGGNDPTCGTLKDAENVVSGFGFDFDARYGQRPGRTDGEKTAARLVREGGIVVHRSALDSSAFAATRVAVEKQLVATQALRSKFPTGAIPPNPLTQAEIDEYRSGLGKAYVALVASLTDEDLRFGLLDSEHTYRLLTNQPSTAPAATPTAYQYAAGFVASPHIEPDFAAAAIGGVSVRGGLPSSQFVQAPMARAGGMQERSQCVEPWGASAVFTDYTLRYAFQDSYALGQTMMSRVVALRETALWARDHRSGALPPLPPEANVTLDEAALTVAEIGTWAGYGRVGLWATQSAPGPRPVPATMMLSVGGFLLDDLGITEPAGLADQLVLVYGEPWVAECAAGLRTGCPENFAQDYEAHGFFAGVTQPDEIVTAATGVYTGARLFGTDGPTIVLQFNANAAPNFQPPFKSIIPTASEYAAHWNKHLYPVLKRDPKKPEKGRILGAITMRDAVVASPAGDRAGFTMLPVSEHMVQLTTDLLGVNSADVQDPGGPDPEGYCIAGVPRKLFVPLENELTSDSDQYENSWKHYLAAAKEAATAADTLGSKLIDIGLQKDLRREDAQEKVGAACGDYGALDGVGVQAGRVTYYGAGKTLASKYQGATKIKEKPSSDSAINDCAGEDKWDFAFFGNDPTPSGTPEEQSAWLRANVLQCPGQTPMGVPGDPANASHPLCKDTQRVITHVGLKFVDEAPPPGNDVDACKELAADAPALRGAGFTGQHALVHISNRDYLSADTLKSTANNVRMDLAPDGEWALLLGKTVPFLDSRAASGLWPGCLRPGATPCADPERAARLSSLFRAPGFAFSEAELPALRWRVEGAVWTIARLAGNSPEGQFRAYVPVRDWSVDPAVEAPYWNTYGLASFVPDPLGGFVPDATTLADKDVKALTNLGVGLATHPSLPPSAETFLALQGDAFGAGAARYKWVPASSTSFGVPNVNGSTGATLAGLLNGFEGLSCATYTGTGAGGTDPLAARTNLGKLRMPTRQLAKWSGQSGYTSTAGIWFDWAGGNAFSHVLRDTYFVDVDDNDDTCDLLNGDDAAVSLPGAEQLPPDMKPGLPGVVVDSTNPKHDVGNDWNPDCPCGGSPVQENCATTLLNFGKDCRVGTTNIKRSCLTNPLVIHRSVDSGVVGVNILHQLLRASTVSPGERATLTAVNALPHLDNCSAAAHVQQALQLACEVSGTAVVPEVTSPPEVKTVEQLVLLEGYVNYVGKQTGRVGSGLYSQGLPKRVSKDFALGKNPTGNVGGTHGQLVLEVRKQMEVVGQSWNRIQSILYQMGATVRDTRSELVIANLQENIAARDLVIRKLGVQKDRAASIAKGLEACTKILDGKPPWSSIFSCGIEGANAATQVYLDQKQLDALDDLSQLQNDLAKETVIKLLTTLNTRMFEEGSQLRDAITALKVSMVDLTQKASALEDNEKLVQYELAKGAGKPFYTTASGQVVALPVNSVLNAEYDVTKRRYEAALKHAKYLSFVARRAIEQRIGVDLNSIHQPVGPDVEPSRWADDICKLQGIDYSKYRTFGLPNAGAGGAAGASGAAGAAGGGAGGTTSANDQTIQNFAEQFVGDYVSRLEHFVEYYNIDFPSHDGDDTAVLSLRDDLARPGGFCERKSRNLLYFSGDLRGTAGGGHGWTPVPCRPDGQVCAFTASPEEIPGGFPPAPGGTSVRTVSWLRTGAAGTPGVGSDAFPPDPTPNSKKPAGPGVYQDVALEPGKYLLSWTDQARWLNGSVANALTDPYTVKVFDASGQQIAGVVQAPTAGGWSPRRVLAFTAATSGSYRVLISPVSSQAIASVLFAEVQLELGSGAPTAYDHNDGSLLHVTTQCKDQPGSAFRALFDHVCPPDGSQCYYTLREPLAVSTEGLGDGKSNLVGKLAAGNYNYRYVTLGLNVVGTGVLDCTQTGQQACFGNGTIEYSLEHDAYDVKILSALPAADDTFTFGTGTMNHAKALAAEKYITTPISSSDGALLQQVDKSELRGRPLDGGYRLRIWDTAALRWDHIEDIQFVAKYHYWAPILKTGKTQ